ncbi:MAG: FHA domain-containing protein [Planctomycetota bacterium]|nr:MAG: FHA domain-containing protein [Planctomycetota bacterium]
MQQTGSPAYLIIQFGNRWSDILRIVPPQTVTIGRSSECQIVVRDERVSRRHAEIAPTDGGWVVRDLGSRNGTLVNGSPIPDAHRLADGEVIQVGGGAITFTHSLSGGLPGPIDSPVTDPSHLTQAGSQSIVRRRNHSQWSAVSSSGAGGISAATQAKAKDELWNFFYRLVFDLVQTQRPSEAAQVALDRLLERLGVEAGGVLLLGTGRGGQSTGMSNVRLLAHHSGPGGTYRMVSDFVADTVLRERQAVLARNVGSDSKLSVIHASDAREVVSVICAPLRRRVPDSRSNSPAAGTAGGPGRPTDEVFGLLHVYSAGEERMLTDADLELAVAVADNLSIALHRQQENLKLARSLERTRRQVDELRQQLGGGAQMVGQSSAITAVREAIVRAAPTSATVLVRGESGVGKELVARAIHDASERRDGPMICLNCAALAPSLLESELFGHEKGAFTGATDRKIGKFEAADGGTLLLDEIGEMPVELQAKLLRVLEGQPFERLGGHKPIQVDVRVVAATNRDLEQAVREKLFRADLYYRLRVVEIEVPPLRHRPEDIAELAEYFLDQFRPHANRKISGISPAALQILTAHDWPGNVRELRNVIERAVVLGRDSEILPEDLNISSLRGDETTAGTSTAGSFEPMPLAELERRHILAVLEHTQGNKSQAAQLLGIERSTLDRKLKRYRKAQ